MLVKLFHMACGFMHTLLLNKHKASDGGWKVVSHVHRQELDSREYMALESSDGTRLMVANDPDCEGLVLEAKIFCGSYDWMGAATQISSAIRDPGFREELREGHNARMQFTMNTYFTAFKLLTSSRDAQCNINWFFKFIGPMAVKDDGTAMDSIIAKMKNGNELTQNELGLYWNRGMARCRTFFVCCGNAKPYEGLIKTRISARSLHGYTVASDFEVEARRMYGEARGSGEAYPGPIHECRLEITLRFGSNPLPGNEIFAAARNIMADILIDAGSGWTTATFTPLRDNGNGTHSLFLGVHMDAAPEVYEKVLTETFNSLKDVEGICRKWTYISRISNGENVHVPRLSNECLINLLSMTGCGEDTSLGFSIEKWKKIETLLQTMIAYRWTLHSKMFSLWQRKRLAKMFNINRD